MAAPRIGRPPLRRPFENFEFGVTPVEDKASRPQTVPSPDTEPELSRSKIVSRLGTSKCRSTIHHRLGTQAVPDNYFVHTEEFMPLASSSPIPEENAMDVSEERTIHDRLDLSVRHDLDEDVSDVDDPNDADEAFSPRFLIQRWKARKSNPHAIKRLQKPKFYRRPHRVITGPPSSSTNLFQCFQEFDIPQMEARADRLSDMESLNKRKDRFEEEIAPEFVMVSEAKEKNLRLRRFVVEAQVEEEEVDEADALEALRL